MEILKNIFYKDEINKNYGLTGKLYTLICVIYIYIYFKNTKNLFIHIALIPEGDNPRVNPNILKCLPFASSEGVSASGDRLQSDGVQDTHLLPHS